MKWKTTLSGVALALAGTMSLAPGFAQTQTGEPNDPNVGAPAGAQAVPLVQVPNAQQTLASAKVTRPDGSPVGTVQEIDHDSSGTVTRVEVRLDERLGMGTRSVWINARKLYYQPQEKRLTTILSAVQLSTM
jgi:hypothetical protein